MSKRFLFAASVSVIVALTAATAIHGDTMRIDSAHSQNPEEKSNDFDVQRDISILEDELHKHFSDPRAYPNYKGLVQDEYGVFYIDNDANKYVFLSDKNDTKAQYLKRRLKAVLGDHIEIKNSKIPYKKLQAIHNEIAKTYENQHVLFSVGVDVIKQKVTIQANFTKDMIKEVIRKYGADAVDIEIYDPGAVAPNGGNQHDDGLEPVQQIGGPNNKVYLSIESEDEIYKKTGFPRYSGKLLSSYGVLPKGTTWVSKPNENVGYRINRLPKGNQVRVSLVELDSSLKPVSTITNQTYDNGADFRMTLPNRSNVMYAMRLELLNDEDQTTDAMLRLIAVVSDEINAKLSTDKTIYNQNETLKFKLTNWGPTSLQFGSNYSLERLESGTWKRLNGWGAFTSELRGVGPKGEYEQTISIKDYGLKPGKYRVIKGVHAAEGKSHAELAAPFEIAP